MAAMLTLSMAAMLALTLICQMFPEALIRFFSREPQVVAFGTDYLRIISWNFMAMALIFTSSSIFQALGNTWPSLGSSALRLLISPLPRPDLLRPGFTIREVWYLSVATIAVQAVSNLVLLHREFRRKLSVDAQPRMAQASAAGEFG
jgi:Na+-driven multidrug efflux pump